MAGQYVLIGKQHIYFPPFFNERLRADQILKKDKALAGPSFWSCTFTALMYGINFGYLGNSPAKAGPKEILELAHASGDQDLRGGATTDLMLVALKKKYEQVRVPQAVGPKLIQKRLELGWMVVAGIRSVDLSPHFARFIGGTGALHRGAFVGFRMANGVPQTRFLDPMAVPSKKNFPDATKYAGEWFPLADYAKACFADQQLWFRPGEFLPAVQRKTLHDFSPARVVTLHKGATIDGFDFRRPERPVLRITPKAATKVHVDRHFSMTLAGKTTEYLAVVDDPLKGLLIKRKDPGVTVDTTGPAPAVAIPLDVGPAPISVEDDVDPPDPNDVSPPGRDGPKDALSTPLDLELDDDPEDVPPPEEDSTAVAA